MNLISESARERPFSYLCGQCSACCKEKIIRVNPYEAARLASHLGISTSYFLNSYTWAAGTILRMPLRGNCIFRGLSGCSVHRDRPLVCRLYPLGRQTAADGKEDFSFIGMESGCMGLHSGQGTVGEYLSEQGAEDYIPAAGRYLELTDRLIAALRREVEGDATLAGVARDLCVAPQVSRQELISRWIDMDRVVSWWRTRTGAGLPVTLEDKMDMHIEAISSWAGRVGGEERETSTTVESGASPRSRANRNISSPEPTRIRTLAGTIGVLGYSIGVNLDEVRRQLGPLEEQEEERGIRA